MPLPLISTRFADELPAACVAWPPAPAPSPRLLHWNSGLAVELGFDAEPPADAAALFSGNALLPGSRPVAQAYAGHQFGGFSPSLGDGRALLLGECRDSAGRLRDIALKGSGRTPFSRGGDGLAAVAPMLRELLIGEGLHALGVPSTRALAVVATGDSVLRERLLPGAVLTRVADSHLRVGSFQYFAARGELDTLRALAAHAMARHGGADPLQLLQGVAQRQARLIAQWMNLGFIHGVMNTDNMTISGESIDFGPCAFMEAYEPATVFSSIDQQGRYAYRNQPLIARWNLARLAESLLPLLADPEGPQAEMDGAVSAVTDVIDAFPAAYDAVWREGQRVKLGLAETDATLADDWLALLQQGEADFTLAWRRLADALEGDEARLHLLFTDSSGLAAWLARWRAACTASPAQLRAVNPLVIPRNHHVEQALAAASEDEDLRPTEALLAALRRPFDEAADRAPYAEPAPRAFSAGFRTFCGT
jgi:uncharacterized protein YdiU (UPF0061 family)